MTTPRSHLSRSSAMQYTIAPLFCRPWTLNGISPRLIESHYENDYGNALDRLNAITEELEALDPATTPGHVVGRLKRDEATVLNSTLLHELYFASLGGDGRTLPEAHGQRDRPRLRFGEPLASGIRRAGRRTGGRLRLGAAHLRAARRTADQSRRVGSRSESGRKFTDPGAGHVRACLSPRVRSQRHSLCRGIHAQHRLERRRDALSKCDPGRTAAAARAEAVP